MNYLSLFSPRYALLLVVLVGNSVAGFAQGLGGGNTGGPPAPTSGAPAAVPLDSGASLLLASGVAYGIKRLRQRRAT